MQGLKKSPNINLAAATCEEALEDGFRRTALRSRLESEKLKPKFCDFSAISAHNWAGVKPASTIVCYAPLSRFPCSAGL